jgi:hypothetical protein
VGWLRNNNPGRLVPLRVDFSGQSRGSAPSVPARYTANATDEREYDYSAVR